MAVVCWGKPTVYIAKLGGGSLTWKKVPNPVENSTQLTTEKGDKQEAKNEGGEVEAVRYQKGTANLQYQIRHAKGKTMPFEDVDGIVEGEHAVVVIPENKEAPGILIRSSAVSAETSYTSEDGLLTTYTHDAQLAEGAKKMVEYGKITVTGEEDSPTKIAIDSVDITESGAGE